MSRHDVVDCVVVGAGPAGLAVSAALTDRGVEHVVLEQGRVGETWRTQRWNSFRLNTPGWMNQMLGGQPPDSYATAAELVRRLDQLAAACPVHDGVRVEQLTNAGEGYIVRTGGGEFHARTVVVATGDENVARIPALARRLPDRLPQYHAATYAAPELLPGGAVLVVGSAQSGCQIAADLLGAGRQVVLATNAVGRVPVRYRGRAAIDWLVTSGFFDQRPNDLPDPAMTRAANPILAPGHSLSLQTLARAGVTLTGRLVAVDGERVVFDDSAHANVAAGDVFAARARAMVDEAIRRCGLGAPPAEPDDAGGPVDLNPPATIDLRADGVGSVVWCTGFTGDFSWLGPALVDADGRPLHSNAAAPVPGVWYVGLRWLIRRGSGILFGFPSDAATVADAVKGHMESRQRDSAKGSR